MDRYDLAIDALGRCLDRIGWLEQAAVAMGLDRASGMAGTCHSVVQAELNRLRNEKRAAEVEQEKRTRTSVGLKPWTGYVDAA